MQLWAIAQDQGINNNLSFLKGSQNDDIDDLISYYEYNPNLTKDSLENILVIMNKNYLDNNKDIPGGIVNFRFIYFYDQYYRIKTYIHKEMTLDSLKQKDIHLQNWFIALTYNYNFDNYLYYDSFYKTFQVLLTHSITTLETNFFTNNFYKISSFLGDDFKNLNALKILMDMYLNFKYNKQYFYTQSGKTYVDNTFIYLPKMRYNKFMRILKKQNIYRPQL